MAGAPWVVHQALLTAFSFIGFCLVSIPLYWHLEAWNIGCILYIFWTGLSCLIQFINFNIWRDHALNLAPVWCDIVIRFQYAAPQGVLCASLVINRRLFKIASTTAVSRTHAQKQRAMYGDLAIGLTFPIIKVALMWFVQGHRFDIYQGVGPRPAIPNTYFAIVLNNVSNIVIGLISMGYCIGTLRAFAMRRKQFSQLVSSNKNLSFNRYFRLMALSSIEMLTTIPLSCFLLYKALTFPIYKWEGLADLHEGFSRVFQIPVIQWQATYDEFLNTILEPWLYIMLAFVFFLFFGLAEEAKTHYRLAFSTVAKRLGYSTGATSSTPGFSPKTSKLASTLPSFVTRSFRRRSISSCSDKLSTDISLGPDVFDSKRPYSPNGSDCDSDSCISTPADDKHIKMSHVASRSTSPVIVESVAPRHSVDVPSSVPHDPMHMV